MYEWLKKRFHYAKISPKAGNIFKVYTKTFVTKLVLLLSTIVTYF